jgi:Fe(3+) dicitrate transport protein
VLVKAFLRSGQRSYIGETEGTYLFSGKKSEIIPLAQASVDVATKISRQVFAKTPGVFEYPMSK